MSTRKAIYVDIKSVVLHECGFKCANPACRMIITLDIHHLEQVSDGGSNDASNLLPLCPNCHAQHHRGIIPLSSLKAWKHLLLALNHAFDVRLVDLLLALNRCERLWVSGDGVLQCSAGIASGLIDVEIRQGADSYRVLLSDKGKRFIAGWLSGNESGAVGLM